MNINRKGDTVTSTMLADMNVSGDLAALLLDYLADNHLQLQALERELRQFQPASRMRFRQWWHLLQILQEQLPERLVGMELGRAIKPSYVGVLGYLTLSCDTVAEALQRFQRYQRLLHDGDTAQFEVRGDLACLCWSSEFGLSTQLSDEVLVMGMVTNLRTMTGMPDLQPSSIHFVSSTPANQDAYRAFVDCPITFNQPRLELHFPMQYLTLPVTNSDPALKQLLEQQAQTLLAVLPQQEDFNHRLQQAILKAIQEGEPTLEQVAESLAMSRRTLHRRLQEKNLVFKDLLQQIRLQLARQYLAEQRLTLAEIALLLGYSEQSAFTRAFKQWSGTTPLQYQKRAASSR
ncbi:MAG: AraC family transcriptional regulator [Ketobacter sp.]|nr:AraC family transcriptional regulator [Ketobacter sp.]